MSNKNLEKIRENWKTRVQTGVLSSM